MITIFYTSHQFPETESWAQNFARAAHTCSTQVHRLFVVLSKGLDTESTILRLMRGAGEEVGEAGGGGGG